MSLFTHSWNLVCSLAGAAFNAGQDAPPARDETKETLLKNICLCAKSGLSYPEFKSSFIDRETIASIEDDYVFACKAVKSYPEMVVIFSDSIARLLFSSGAIDAASSFTEVANPLRAASLRSASTESIPSEVALAAPSTSSSRDRDSTPPARTPSPRDVTPTLVAVPTPTITAAPSPRLSPFEDLEECDTPFDLSDDEDASNNKAPDLSSLETEASTPKACGGAGAPPETALLVPAIAPSVRPPLPLDLAPIKRGPPKVVVSKADPLLPSASRGAAATAATAPTSSSKPPVPSELLLKELFGELDKEAKELNSYGKALVEVSYLCKKAMLMALEEHLSKQFKIEERLFVKIALSRAIPTFKAKILKALEADDMDEMRMWAADLAKKIRPEVVRLTALQIEKRKAATEELHKALEKQFAKDEIAIAHALLKSVSTLPKSIQTLYMLCIHGAPSEREARINQLIRAIKPKVLDLGLKNTLRDRFAPNLHGAVETLIRSSRQIQEMVRNYQSCTCFKARSSIKTLLTLRIVEEMKPKKAKPLMNFHEEAEMRFQALLKSLESVDDDDEDL